MHGHNSVNGGGVGSRVDSKHLQEVKECGLIVCSSCNISSCQVGFKINSNHL